MEDYLSKKGAIIDELKSLIEKYKKSGQDSPRAIGGPFNLSLEQMIEEIEKDTNIGRQVVEAFSALKRDFPNKS